MSPIDVFQPAGNDCGPVDSHADGTGTGVAMPGPCTRSSTAAAAGVFQIVQPQRDRVTAVRVAR